MSRWKNQGLVRSEVPAVPPGLFLLPLPLQWQIWAWQGWVTGPGPVPEVKVSLMLSSLLRDQIPRVNKLAYFKHI